MSADDTSRHRTVKTLLRGANLEATGAVRESAEGRLLLMEVGKRDARMGKPMWTSFKVQTLQ